MENAAHYSLRNGNYNEQEIAKVNEKSDDEIVHHLSTPPAREDDSDDEISTSATPKDYVEHKWLLIFSSVYIFTFAGAMWGWGPMQLLLEENGAFHSLCQQGGEEVDDTSKNPHNVCPEQAARLITA